ncbi:MAG: hypothetical protein A2X25_02345 [Chloroflexi bacterium GWB2_49_20]|nr:MAG: hypothetical protein A2X25_02345 [Chloroflexi bacterium GWB2_49_20]OGN79695.1 MAG: hypothetical protein A2X26_07325 [Chloroflexi bacterium GWC2_49_37]OGN85943.1 MAG: hypothetical protein A2X27_00085 [Chloroflexi bacterium GWD2_49_16]HBG73998.1 hypothetical protein [Anaerolineae bacterium]HCC78736.1 hypothetical protein [Anaerolineae bacterium]
MVTYHLKHMGLLKKSTKLLKLDVEVQQEFTARELLLHLLECSDQINDKENRTTDIYKNYLILVNGFYLSELGGFDTLLKDRDSVVILSPIIGG